MREWFSVGELAGLPGLPKERANVRRKAVREGWVSRPRTKRGGGSEYHVSSLPQETQAEIAQAATEDDSAMGESDEPQKIIRLVVRIEVAFEVEL